MAAKTVSWKFAVTPANVSTASTSIAKKVQRNIYARSDHTVAKSMLIGTATGSRRSADRYRRKDGRTTLIVILVGALSSWNAYRIVKV